LPINLSDITGIRATLPAFLNTEARRDIVLTLNLATTLEQDLYCNNFGLNSDLVTLDIISNDVCVEVVAGSIGDTVYIDVNSDGIQDSGDIAFTGVTLELQDAMGNPILIDPVTGAVVSADFPGAVPYQVTTDANGNYSFDNLPSGEYVIVVDQNTLPADAVQTADPDGIFDSISSQTLTTVTDASGNIIDVEDNTAQDFGYNAPSLTNPVFPGVANGPTYFLWNNNLDMMNVSEMVNGGGVFFDSVISVFSDTGNFEGEFAGWLQPDGANHAVIPQSSAPYGIGRMDLVPAGSANTFDGLLAQYRFAPDGNELEFAKFSPYIQATSGTKYVSYNTFQPSLNPAELGNEVTSWVEVANPDPAPKSFTVNLYDTLGNLVSSQALSVPAMGRFDVQGGHITPGAANQGLVEVIPSDPNAPFITQVSRYGGDAPAGVAPASFSFASTSVGNDGFTSEIVAPVSSGGGAQNWVIVTNTASTATSVLVEFLDYSANIVQSSTVNIAGMAQATFNADSLFPGGASGLVRITPQGTEPIIADSTFFFFKADGSISSAYITHAEPNYSVPKHGTFNTFLGQQNWLKLYNDSTSTQTVTINVNQLGIANPAVPLGSTTVTLAPGQGIDAELEATLGFNIPDNTYGTVEVDSTGNGIFAQILRLRLLNGFIDLAEGIPVR